MADLPERRRSERVALATRVWLLSGACLKRATLRDGSAVSLGLDLTGRRPSPGQRVAVLLPHLRHGWLPVLVFGRVVRSDEALGLVFTSIPRRSRLSLQTLLLAGKPGTVGESRAGARRRTARRHYNVRLTAKSVWLPHVLVARDLSPDGVRVHALPWAEVGSELQISFPVPGSASPVSIAARVARHDGSRGTVLRFQSVTPEQREDLDGLLALLPELPDGRREGVAIAAVENGYAEEGYEVGAA